MSDELDIGVSLKIDDVEVSKMAVPGVPVAQCQSGNHNLEDPVSQNDVGLWDEL